MLVSDDVSMQVLYEQRDSSTLVITFAPRSIFADGSNFWARGALQKVGVSGLGFMPKGSNWYVPSIMEKALECARTIASRYGRVIVYGGSAGAYAAAKWSKFLGADYSISLAPQWTIDPHITGRSDQRFASYFTENMRGMELKPNDIGGRIYVFYDPYHKEDLYHAETISKMAASIELVPCPYMHHSVIELFAGTKQLTSVIDACSTTASKDLPMIAGHIRRENKYRLYFILAKMFIKRPDLAMLFLEKRSDLLWVSENFFVDLGDYVEAKGKKSFAQRIFKHGLIVHPLSVKLEDRLGKAVIHNA